MRRVPVWWPVPTENTLDRGTTVLPGYLYERLDEIGLDFTIVYPGRACRSSRCRACATTSLRARRRARSTSTTPRCSPGYGDRMIPTGGDPDAHARRSDRGAASSSDRARAQGVRVRGRRAAPGAAVRARASRPRALRCFYQDCFGIDSPYDYDPVWHEVHRPRRRADVPLGPDRLGHARVGHAPPVQPDRRLRRGRRGDSPSRCSSAASRSGSRRCASASSRAA